MDDIRLTPTDKLRKFSSEMTSPVVLLSCGSFSPVTKMHILLLESARKTLESLGHTVLGGYLSPVHNGYMKASLLSGAVRLHMLHLATQASDWLMADPWEVAQKDPSPSFLVAEHISVVLTKAEQTKGSNAKIIFVCGADLVRDMLNPHKWSPENVHRLLRLSTLAVHPRQGAEGLPPSLQNESGEKVDLINISADLMDGSSTLVRHCLAAKQPVSHLLHEDVANYILKEGLYST